MVCFLPSIRRATKNALEDAALSALLDVGLWHPLRSERIGISPSPAHSSIFIFLLFRILASPVALPGLLQDGTRQSLNGVVISPYREALLVCPALISGGRRRKYGTVASSYTRCRLDPLLDVAASHATLRVPRRSCLFWTAPQPHSLTGLPPCPWSPGLPACPAPPPRSRT